MTGKGIDRHLFALYVVSKYLDVESEYLKVCIDWIVRIWGQKNCSTKGCIFVIAESFEWALATFNFSNSSQRRVCRPQTREWMYFSWRRIWACGWWWIWCILHHCGRRLHFLSCICEEKLPRNRKFQLKKKSSNYDGLFNFAGKLCNLTNYFDLKFFFLIHIFFYFRMPIDLPKELKLP